MLLYFIDLPGGPGSPRSPLSPSLPGGPGLPGVPFKKMTSLLKKLKQLIIQISHSVSFRSWKARGSRETLVALSAVET